MDALVHQFIEQSVYYIGLNPPRIRKCLSLLDENQIWIKPNEQSNSIGNLILHLCGNITQYVLSGLGGLKDERMRDREFTAKGGLTKAELLNKMEAVTDKAVAIIRAMDEKSLTALRMVQGFELTGTAIIIHVTEHFSYHIGQIALLTKLFDNKDLGFYEGVDLQQKNTAPAR